MKHRLLLLIICIPLASVAFGGVMFYFAHNTPDRHVSATEQPLSKTSWQARGPEPQP